MLTWFILSFINALLYLSYNIASFSEKGLVLTGNLHSKSLDSRHCFNEGSTLCSLSYGYTYACVILKILSPFSKISITQKQLYYYYIQKIEKLKRKKIKSIYEYTHTHENSETLHIKIFIAFISR